MSEQSTAPVATPATTKMDPGFYRFALVSVSSMLSANVTLVAIQLLGFADTRAAYLSVAISQLIMQAGAFAFCKVWKVKTTYKLFSLVMIAEVVGVPLWISLSS